MPYCVPLVGTNSTTLGIQRIAPALLANCQVAFSSPEVHHNGILYSEEAKIGRVYLPQYKFIRLVNQSSLTVELQFLSFFLTVCVEECILISGFVENHVLD